GPLQGPRRQHADASSPLRAARRATGELGRARHHRPQGTAILSSGVNERDLDVVVFGATGITGRQVAVYLAERSAETGARWAAAGRDPAKLERVLGEVGVTAPETIVAELSDESSLAAMASRAKVVLNLCGPY